GGRRRDRRLASLPLRGGPASVGAAVALHAGRGAARAAGDGGVPRSAPERARVPDRASLPPERSDHEPAAQRARRRPRARARLRALRHSQRALLRARIRPRPPARPRPLLADPATDAADRPGPLRSRPLRRLRADPAAARPADGTAGRTWLGRAGPRCRLGRTLGAVLRLGTVAA